MFERVERCDPLLPKTTKNPKPNTNEDHETERGDPLYSDIPDWLQEFRENLVDDRVPERRHSNASFSHEPFFGACAYEKCGFGGKHIVKTHFPRDRNCEICQRTKITRASCRRRTGGAVHRADIFVI